MTEPRVPGGESHDDRADARLDDEVRAAYRQHRAADAGARARVLSRLAAEPARAGGLRWWFARQPFQLRPAWALAALAAVLVAGSGLGAWLARAPRAPREVGTAPGAGTSATAAASAGLPVTFILRAPGATSVSVVGDFNNWDVRATPMSRSGSGDLWVLNLRLARGVHHYSFVLDGSEWRPDPSAPLSADDPFGGHNSVIVVNGALL